ncbi:MAG: hypothetical protein HYZ42_01240, partial [Bacteroidetes bacterium]|nr:hypothetical protein [Bacteroidota bacterium]
MIWQNRLLLLMLSFFLVQPSGTYAKDLAPMKVKSGFISCIVNTYLYKSSKIDGRSKHKECIAKYDNTGNKIEELKYTSGGEPGMRSVCKYDNKGNLVNQILYRSDGSIDQKENSKYDAKGNRIEYTASQPNGKIQIKITNKYNNKGKMTEEVWYSSDGSVYSKETYMYNDKSSKIDKILYNTKGGVDRKSISKLDEKGNVMIEPVGGKTKPYGQGGVSTRTTYPNGSNY